ncbi:MAG: ThuA domain-containing protein [Vicinamibacterales bacterium]
MKPICAVLVAGVLSAGTGANDTPRVLYLTHSAGFKHDVLPVTEEVMRDLGKRSGAFEATVTQDCSLISEQSLRNYAAVIFFTTGELPIDEAQKKALVEFVRSGRGFVGIHSATDTFYKWPEYLELIGGYFDGHPWHQEVTVRVDDPTHPATAQLPAAFTISDEIYQFRAWSRDRVRVLLSLDPASVDLTKKGVHRADKDFALAWAREFGRGRMFYTALGHEAAVWRDPRFQQHLAGGIQWATGSSSRR